MVHSKGALLYVKIEADRCIPYFKVIVIKEKMEQANISVRIFYRILFGASLLL